MGGTSAKGNGTVIRKLKILIWVGVVRVTEGTSHEVLREKVEVVKW